ncbi:hypothetical protein PHLGIDRAFT_20708 [Phlebiopsis gigantea 11061_1 CR5-6]|uniref:Haloacid dehalogenase n=1 Tax=Phlebiopsis gigantea (strain 11061_1 CR5-6) TaxID=745531 RepID=A0A0C3P8Z0_PHLG1|nr:hypothetical protein PHLGIDRAFT_20708 [Phlebiopsis gigantea 11061_1 CR5-6]
MSSADSTRNVLAFDIYGTILNTNSVGVTLQSLLSISEDQANAVCLLWRRYQLEYTWRLNSMGVYEPFDVVTSNALQHALSEHGHPHDEQLTAQIMASYNHLKP